MAKKEPNIADLISMMEKNQATDKAASRISDDAAATDSIQLKGSLDNLNSSFGNIFGKKVDTLAAERIPFQHTDLLDQIRMGVDGMKLSLTQRFKRFFTNFLGMAPSLAARKAAREADLATKLIAIDTATTAEASMAMLDTMREQSGLSKIGQDRDERRSKAIWGAKGFFSKNFSRIGSAFGWITGKGGAGKEQENEERRHKSRHITLLEAILEAIGGIVPEDGGGGPGGGKMGRWALVAKRLATIAGIIIGIVIAPFVLFAAFGKQLAVETKAIAVWVAKAAKWGKGTFFDPVKNAFNRIFKVGEWADDFKKGFNRQWNRFKARFNPSSLMQIFSRFKTRLASIRLNMINSLTDAMKGFRESKAVTNLMARISAFGNTLKGIKNNMIKVMRDTMKAFRQNRIVTNLMTQITSFGSRLTNIKTDMMVKARNAMKVFRQNRIVTNLMTQITSFGSRLTNIKTDMMVKARNAMKAFRQGRIVTNLMTQITSFGGRLTNIKTNMMTSVRGAMKLFREGKFISNLTATIGSYGTRLNNIKNSFNSSLGRAVRAFGKTKAVTNIGATFGFLSSQYNKVATRLNNTVTRASAPRVGPRSGPRTVNPFTTLRTSFSTAQASMSTRIAGWSQAFSKSPMIQKLGGMFNTLKIPFIAVQEFLTGKKVAKPAGMPPMIGGAPKTAGGIMRIVSGIGTFFGAVGGKIMQIPGITLITKPAAFLGKWFGKLFWPVTAIFAIFDGIKQWKTDEGFSEETKPDTILKKIRASVTRALANLVGMFLDMPKMLITWIMDKAGLGKQTVGDPMSGGTIQVDAPWMKKLKAFSFSEMLFQFTWAIGSIPGQIFDFISGLIMNPVATIKGIFNSQWVKDNIWDSGQQARPGPKGAKGSPMRLFGIPLVMPSLPNINWPNWGQLFRDYIYDGSVEGQVKILGITLKWPTLSEDFSLLDLLPAWLRNPKEFFSGWFKGVKSFFGFGDDDKPADAKLTGIRESITKIQAERKKMEAEAMAFLQMPGTGGSTLDASGKVVSMKEFWSNKIQNARNVEKIYKNMEQTRLQELAGGIIPDKTTGGTGGGSVTTIVDGSSRTTTAIAINANQGMSDGSTFVGSTGVQ